MPTPLRLNEMTRDEVRAVAPHATVVIPVAATEQHGPHLPLLVDHYVVEAMALAAAERAAAEIPVTVTPTQAFGSSHHHQVFCAISLSSDTLYRVLMDIGTSLIRMGFRSLYLLNGHGGNDDLIRQTCRDLAVEHPVRTGAASYWTLAAQAFTDLHAGELGATPGHAGGFETSLMLALRPEFVHRDRYPTTGGFPLNARGRGGLFVQQHGVWQESGGYSEPPIRASAVQGQHLWSAAVDAVAASLVEFHGGSRPFLSAPEAKE